MNKFSPLLSLPFALAPFPASAQPFSPEAVPIHLEMGGGIDAHAHVVEDWLAVGGHARTRYLNNLFYKEHGFLFEITPAVILEPGEDTELSIGMPLHVHFLPSLETHLSTPGLEIELKLNQWLGRLEWVFPLQEGAFEVGGWVLPDQLALQVGGSFSEENGATVLSGGPILGHALNESLTLNVAPWIRVEEGRALGQLRAELIAHFDI